MIGCFFFSALIALNMQGVFHMHPQQAYGLNAYDAETLWKLLQQQAGLVWVWGSPIPGCPAHIGAKMATAASLPLGKASAPITGLIESLLAILLIETQAGLCWAVWSKVGQRVPGWWKPCQISPPPCRPDPPSSFPVPTTPCLSPCLECTGAVHLLVPPEHKRPFFATLRPGTN